jgi:hypothetical protein
MDQTTEYLFVPGLHFFSYGCRLRWSSQHSPEIYPQECGILRCFWVVDSGAARPGRAAVKNSQTDGRLKGSIAVRADWHSHSCPVGTRLADRRSRRTCISGGTVKSLCFAISSQRYQVSERRRVAGRLRICLLNACNHRRVFTRTLISIAMREWRSANVGTLAPLSRSPSQESLDLPLPRACSGDL